MEFPCLQTCVGNLRVPTIRSVSLFGDTRSFTLEVAALSSEISILDYVIREETMQLPYNSFSLAREYYIRYVELFPHSSHLISVLS